MEYPIQDVLNLDESSGFAVPVNMNVTDAANAPAAAPAGRANILTVTLDRGRNPREKWGFRLTGGKDRGLPLQLLQIPLNSIAGKCGLRSNDYLVKINGRDVFNMTHDEAKRNMAQSADKLSLVIERGEHIVPSMNDAFPEYAKKKEPEPQPVNNADKPYYQRVLEATGELPGQQNKGFTTVGKPKMATKQFNSPLEMYGDEALEEIMEQGTLFGREIDPTNPWNATGKQLDMTKSDVLSAINSSGGGGFK